jgi:hypothetical protein
MDRSLSRTAWLYRRYLCAQCPRHALSPAALTVPCMHWTSFRREGVLRYSVLLEDATEVDLVQADGGWKLCYSTSAAKDRTVVDLGSCHNEGELLIAADDRLAELLQWAGAGTRNDFVAAAVKTSRFSRRLQLDPGLMPPTSWSLTPCIDPLQLPRRLGEKSRRWRDLSHAPRKCRKSLRRRWFLEPSERQRAPGHR